MKPWKPISANKMRLQDRLLASIRKEECTCAETTCNHCIAVFIEQGGFRTADVCLSRLEALDGDAQRDAEESDDE